MMKKRVILISFFGPSGSGKSTCYKYAEQFLRREGYKVHQTNVAYPLRCIQSYAYELFGLEAKDPQSDDFKQDGELLGFLAKHFEKSLARYTTKIVQELVASDKAEKLAFINTDCRNNAYKELDNLGFVFVRLSVDAVVLKKRRAQRGDITEFNYESDVEKCDAIKPSCTIDNNGSVKELGSKIGVILKDMISPPHH